MAPVTHGWVMTSPSSAPERSIQRAMRSDPNRRIKSSSSERKKTLWPGSPWRPERHEADRSGCSCTCPNADSRYLMPHTWHFLTPGPSLMTVPRPAMLVAIVMEPGWPACATISASRSWYLAFSTRSEEHTSELQSLAYLVCRLLLEKKK